MRRNQDLYERKWRAEELQEDASTRIEAANPSFAVRQGALRVLVIAHIATRRDRMDKSHYRRYKALARHPGVALFGPGIEGYRQGMSVHEAVTVACQGAWPDVILHGADLKESGVPLVTGLENAPAVTAIELLDSWTRPERQIAFIRRHHFQAGLIQEAGPHLAFYQQHCPETKFYWTPNAVDTRLFRNYGLAKEYDVILYGEISPEVYPLRARLAELLARGEGLRFRHIRHPGYYPPACTRETGVLIGEDLSREINQAWIGIATRSVYDCFLMKYLEIAASYALVAGNMPDHARSVFGDDFVELSMDQSDGEILAAVHAALADKGRLLAMTDGAHRRVVHEYSTERFAEKALGLLQDLVKERKPPTPGSAFASPPVKQDPVRLEKDSADTDTEWSIRAAPGGGLLLARQNLLISCCMIVRDNEHTIEPAIRSIQPWVDEIVVVDTGSKDRTPEVVESLGCRLYRFPWCDDFSAARNESLKYGRGKWLFWMDSDDVIDEANGRALRALVEGPVADSTLGFTMKVRCPCKKEDGSEDFIEVDQLKLFRNLPYLRFEGMIHEQIIPAINRAGGDKVMTDLFLIHANSDRTAEGLIRKLERDLRILHKELKQRPQHPFTLFNLGMTYLDGGDHGKAEEFLRRCIQHSTPSESHLRKAYAYLAECCQARGRDKEAGLACDEGLKLFPEDAELRFLHAGLLHRQGKLRQAVQVYQGLFQTNGDHYFSSRNRGITGFLARQNLAGVYDDLGDVRAAQEQWRAVVAEMPRYRPGLFGLGEILIKQGKEQEMLRLVNQCERDHATAAVALVLRGKLAKAAGRWADAKQAFARAVRQFPRDRDAREALCHFLFEHGTAEEAECSLREQLALEPGNGAAYHNLGATLCRMGRLEEAVKAYQESLRLRPDYLPTLLQLGRALLECRRNDQARDIWEQVLQLDPSNQEANEALANVPGLVSV